MSENNVVEFTQRDKDDLASLGVADEPSFHPLLQIWTTVLTPAGGESKEMPTAAWCNRIISGYQQITFADMIAFRDKYFTKVEELAEILRLEVASDPEAFSYTTPEEDVENNTAHYKNVLLNWQLQVQQWELDWECTDADAAIELAAISEVHKMFFGPTGIVAFLDNIKFEFTEADQQMLSEALQAQRVNGE
jgi:hypothetical protein